VNANSKALETTHRNFFRLTVTEIQRYAFSALMLLVWQQEGIRSVKKQKPEWWLLA